MGAIAKLSPEMVVTLPQWAVEAIGNPSYFDIQIEGGRLVLTPADQDSAAAARRDLAELGITEQDVDDAVAWTRQAR